MADPSYSKVYSKLGEQRSQIETEREKAQQYLGKLSQTPGRFKSGQYRDPSVWAKERQMRKQLAHEQRVRESETQRTKQFLSELETSEKELKESESKIKKYEKEGYSLSETDEGLSFSKQVITYKKVPVKRKVVKKKRPWYYGIKDPEMLVKFEHEGKIKSAYVRKSRLHIIPGKIVSLKIASYDPSKTPDVPVSFTYKTVPITKTVTKTMDVTNPLFLKLLNFSPILKKLSKPNQIQRSKDFFLYNRPGIKPEPLYTRRFQPSTGKVVKEVVGFKHPEIDYSYKTVKHFQPSTGTVVSDKVLVSDISRIPEQQKHEVGYKYTDWESIPIAERKHHYGSKRYFASLSKTQKETMITEHLDKHPVKEIQRKPYRVVHDVGKYLFPTSYEYTEASLESGKTPPTYKTGVIRKRAWEDITKSDVELQSQYWKQMSYPSKAMHTWTMNFMFGLTAIPSLAQTGVKLATGKGGFFERIETGKTLFLPDISKNIGRLSVGEPTGAIGTAVSEIITLGKSDAWERFKQDPFLSVVGTGGEIFGFYLGRKTIIGGIKTGFKYGISQTPKVYGKFQTFKGGPTYHLQPGGTPTKVPTFLSKVGQKPFWRNIHGWSKGELVFVKKIPLKSETFYKGERLGVQEGSFNIFAVKRIYKGFGKTELVPKAVAEQINIGSTAEHIHRFLNVPKSGIGGKRIQSFTSSYVSKPKGYFWKRIKTQTVMLSEEEAFFKTDLGVTQPSIMDASMGYGSWIRPGYEAPVKLLYKQSVKMPNLWKDTKATQTLVPVTRTHGFMTGGMHGTGYIKGSISLPKAEFASLSTSGLITIGALTSKLEYEYPQQSEHIIRQIQKPMKELIPKQKEVQVSSYSFASDFVTENISKQNQIQKKIQKQATVSLTKQDLVTPLTTVQKGGVSSYKKQYDFSFKTPKFWLLDDETYSKKGRRRKRKGSSVDIGYRYRQHKVPSVESLIPDSVEKILDGGF